MTLNINKLLATSQVIGLLGIGALAGCATTAPSGAVADPAVGTNAAVAQAHTPTEFDAQTKLDEDDFWNTGTTVSVDDDGRLLYASAVDLVVGSGVNASFDVNNPHAHDPQSVYIDPRTGRQIILNRGSWRRVPRSVIVPPSQAQMPTGPLISEPRPPSSRIDTPRPRRAVDGARRERR